MYTVVDSIYSELYMLMFFRRYMKLHTVSGVYFDLINSHKAAVI